MEMDSTSSETTPVETPAVKSGRPPPIFLTSAINLIHLQKQVKSVLKQDFEFRTTRNRTKIITRDMADFQSIKSHFDTMKLSYYRFFPKSEKPIKAVIRHLPTNTPAEDICGGLVSLGFDVVSVKKMTTTRRSSPDDPQISNLPFPGNPTKNPKVPGNISAPIPLPHLHEGRGLQSRECPHAVSQLPAIRARLGKLQTAATLFMVRGRTPAQRVPREGKC
jgi:hypothetical protein